MLTTCILSVLLNRLTACINLRGKLLLLAQRYWLLLWLVIPTNWLLNLTYLALYYLTLLLCAWSLHLPAVQLIEPSSFLRLMCLQSDVGCDDFTYLNVELLNLVRTINLDNGS